MQYDYNRKYYIERYKYTRTLIILCLIGDRNRMRKNDKLIVVLGIAILVVSSIGIYFWTPEVTIADAAKIEDIFNISSVYLGEPDAVTVSDSCPFYALIATPLTIHYDQDGIPYWAEVNVIKTDPRIDDSKLDPDGDGIPTSWEWKWNYDPKIWDDHVNLDPDIDGLENIEEYQMHKWFANPFSQDIYVEVDGMKKRGLLGKDHTLFEESKQIVIERFCLHGINIYIDNIIKIGRILINGLLLICLLLKPYKSSGYTFYFYR